MKLAPLPAKVVGEITENIMGFLAALGMLFWFFKAYRLHLWWVEFFPLILLGYISSKRKWLPGKFFAWCIFAFIIVFIVTGYLIIYVPDKKNIINIARYIMLGLGALWISLSIVEVNNGFTKGRSTFKRVLRETEKISFADKLEFVNPGYLPEGYTKGYEEKEKSEVGKDVSTIHYNLNKTDFFIYLTESNGPLAPEIYEETPSRTFFYIRGITVTVVNPITQALKRRGKTQMDAQWIYKGQSYRIVSDVISTSELEKIIESMIK